MIGWTLLPILAAAGLYFTLVVAMRITKTQDLGHAIRQWWDETVLVYSLLFVLAVLVLAGLSAVWMTLGAILALAVLVSLIRRLRVSRVELARHLTVLLPIHLCSAIAVLVYNVLRGIPDSGQFWQTTLALHLLFDAHLAVVAGLWLWPYHQHLADRIRSSQEKEALPDWEAPN